MTALQENLLLIFTRNPELGKCKTRLAAVVGDQVALDVYVFLLRHTVALTQAVAATKRVSYSESIGNNDIWDSAIFEKKLQQGPDLGERMKHAFAQGFADGFKRIVIIGSDMYNLTTEDIDRAFEDLGTNDYVIGPAEDGGYYLLGMTQQTDHLFADKTWGTETVLQDTLNDLKEKKVAVLETRNDVDYYEDIKDIDAFQPFIKDLKL